MSLSATADAFRRFTGDSRVFIGDFHCLIGDSHASIGDLRTSFNAKNSLTFCVGTATLPNAKASAEARLARFPTEV